MTKKKHKIYFKEKNLQEAYEKARDAMKKAGYDTQWVLEHFS